MSVFAIPMRLRRRRRSRGQSLVEFALILPLLMLFLAAVLDLGRIFYANISLLNAAREGAFQAAKTPDSFIPGADCDENPTADNMIVCRVQLESMGSMVTVDAADIALECSATGCPPAAGSTVTVKVEGSFTLLTPLLGTIFGGQTIPLEASATTQIEYFPVDGVSTLPPTPTAVITANPTSGEGPLTVTFSATSSGGSPNDWIWTFGDGDTAHGSDTVTHTYTTPGSYTVTLRVINQAGDDTDTATITVVAPAATPTPTPVGTPTPTPTPNGTPTPTPAPSPTPEQCSYPPNTIGKTPAQAADLLNGWTYVMHNDMTTGQKGKIQAQTPDHTLCKLKSSTTVVLHYRPNSGV